jgi:glutamyl endopeptidase
MLGIKRETQRRKDFVSAAACDERSRRRMLTSSRWLLVIGIFSSALFSIAIAGGDSAYAAQNRSHPLFNPNAVASLTGGLPRTSAETLGVTSSSPSRGSEPALEGNTRNTTDESVPQASSTPTTSTLRLHFDIPSTLDAWWCTGFMVGPTTVATAGHCVFTENSRQWADKVQVYLSGSTKAVSGCGAVNLYSVLGWTNPASVGVSSDQRWYYDYGAVVLNCSLGNKTGWLGLTSSTPSTEEQSIMNGYPNHVVVQQSYSGKVTSWAYISYDGQAKFAGELNTSDMGATGSSGSPMWNNQPSGVCEGPCVIAIDSHTAPPDPSAIGTLLTSPEVDNYINWGAE